MKQLTCTALLWALALGVAMPAVAHADTEASVVGDEIRIESGPEDNSIEVGYQLFAGFVSIEDPGVPLIGTPTCPEDGDRLECPLSKTTTGIVAETGGGADRMEFLAAYLSFVGPLLATSFSGGSGDDTFAAIGRGRLDGGPGKDRLTGGSLGDDPDNVLLGGGGADVLTDNEGDDALKGGGGGDRLKGGDDRDRYAAGSGRDRVRARDFTQDRRINCGSGDDRLRSDPFDPAPQSC
jgi:hypothetical protein